MAVEAQAFEARQVHELAKAFSAMTAWRDGAVVVLSDPFFGLHLAQISRLAIESRLPAIYVRREFADAGGLLAYGPSFAELIVNMKTAKELGVTVPPSLVVQADRLIE